MPMNVSLNLELKVNPNLDELCRPTAGVKQQRRQLVWPRERVIRIWILGIYSINKLDMIQRAPGVPVKQANLQRHFANKKSVRPGFGMPFA